MHCCPICLAASFIWIKSKLRPLCWVESPPTWMYFIIWINYFYPTSMLVVHRGFTHSFFFGFFTVLVLLYLASRNPFKVLFQKFFHFNLSISFLTIVFACSGLISHLFLDFLTTRGVPLFYPWEATRYSAEIFFHIEIIILIANLILLAVLLMKKLCKDKAQTALNKNLFLIFIALFLVTGAIRIEGKEATKSFFANGNAEVYPDSSLFQWAVLENDSERFSVYEFDSLDGEIQHNSRYSHINILSEAEGSWDAIEKAEILSQVKLFRWRAYAVAINATLRNGSWYLEYYDPIVKTEMANAWTISKMASKSYESILIKVGDKKVQLI
jgi:inner membrane protein